MEKGPVDPNATNANGAYYYNEMQAGIIEKKFMQSFCGQTDEN